jgi:hypothetical protein
MINRSLGVVLACVLVAVVAAGCGSGVGRDGDVVGGSCTASGGCAGGSECLIASMYPGGMCTVDCETQADCPSGSVCVQESGGTCLLACSSSSDCRDGYGCEDKSTVGDGHATVCIR